MSERISVNMALTADTAQAKSALKDLQNQLTQLATTSTSKSTGGMVIGKELEKAAKSAAELKQHLEQATNAKTGNLDYSKLSQSLAKSKMSLSEYAAQLQKLGPQGQAAFSSLATAIAASEIPLKRSNKILTDFATTLKNTAKWQISSSILHGFMSTISQAYNYAERLNGSLNNIRIVTGQSVDQMARFAEQANRSARELSSSTTAYTDAALIYYQQGLSDTEVKERADVTIKMANVARENATDVSSYMTAIWNNFNKAGNESAEHFADVMTKLGATTAASTKEIAGGLEKFASIADAIGLSFDYASSILATIVDKTRQSEDVVGTALKTIFARVQGLKLGETLEDGVDLNKYSKALKAVGVDVLDATGNLRDADNILEDTAEKWGNISKSQQVALAQTVAGVRQYNQFVAMMDNWDAVEENLNTARNADGTLQEQADIYAESWEAARMRVRAAAEAIYSDLLNDDFFISLFNGIEKALTGLDKFIDALGGLKGVLAMIGTIATRLFQEQMASGLVSMANTIKLLTPKGREAMQQERSQAMQDMANQVQTTDYRTKEEEARANNMRTILELEQQLTSKSQQMSEAELNTNKIMMDRVRLLSEQNVLANKNADLARDKASDAVFAGKTAVVSKNVDSSSQEISKAMAEYDKLVAKMKIPIQIKVEAKNGIKNVQDAQKVVEQLKNNTQTLKLGKDVFHSFHALTSELEASVGNAEEFEAVLARIASEAQEIQNNLGKDLLGMTDDSKVVDEVASTLEGVAQANIEVESSSEAMKDSVDEASKNLEQAGDSAEKAKQKQEQLAQTIVSVAGAISAITMTISMLQGAFDTLSDPDTSWFEKFITILSTTAMVVPMLIMSFQELSLSLEKMFPAGIKASLGLSATATASEVVSAAATKAKVAIIGLKSQLFIIGAVVTAIALISKVLSETYNEINKQEIAAQKAHESAEKMGKAFEDAKSASDKLKNSINAYDTAAEKLNNCVRGTKEWREALLDTNQAALDLIDSIKGLTPEELSGLYSRDASTGQIVFDEERLQQAQTKLDNQVTSTRYASANADYQAEIADADVLLKGLAKDIFKGNTVDEISQDTGILKRNLEELSQVLTADELREKLTQLGASLDYVSDSEISAWGQSFMDLSNNAEVAAMKLGLIGDISVDEIMNGATGSSAAKKYASNKLQQTDSDVMGDWRRRATSAGMRFAGTDSDAYQEALASLRAAGYDYSATDGNAIQGSGDDIKYYFKDSDNKEFFLTPDEIIDRVGIDAAMQDVQANVTAATEALSGLGREGYDFANKAIEGFDVAKDKFDLTGFAQELTEEELAERIKAIKTSEKPLAEATAESLGMTVGQLEQIAELYGKTGTELAKALLSGMRDVLSTELEGLEGLDKGDMTKGEQIDFSKNKRAAQGNLEEYGLENYLGDGRRGGINAENADNAEGLNGFYEGLSKINLTSEHATQEVMDLANQFGIAGASTRALIEAINGLDKTYEVSSKNISNTINELKGLADLEVGDTISEKKYNKLSEKGIDVDKYFNLMADGTYQLIGDAEALQAAIRGIPIEELKQQLLDFQSARNQVYNEDSPYVNNNLTNTGVVGKEASSESQNLGQARLDYISSFDPNSFDFASALGEEGNTQLLGLLNEYQTNPELQLTSEQLQLIADAIGVVNEAEQEMQGQLLTTVEDTGQLLAMLEQLGDVAEDEVAGGLINLASKLDNCKEEIADYQQALRSGNQEQKKAARDMLLLSTASGEMAKKYGLSADAIESYAKELKASGKYANVNGRELAEMAKDQQRYDRAVVSGQKNLQKWNKDLQLAKKTGHVAADTIAELADAYGDMLDLDPGEFSSEFLSSADNLKLFEQALNGSQEAYDQLREKARQEIAVKAGFDDAKFQAGFNDLMDKYYEGQNLDDIEVGADLNNEGFLAGLTEMVNAAGMTAQQATDYLSSMGVDANVEEKTIQKHSTVAGYTAIVSDSGPAYDATGEPHPVSSVSYIPNLTPITGEETVTSLEVTSANKSSGGNIKHSGSNAANGGGRGGGGRGGGGGGRAARRNAELHHNVNEDLTRFKGINYALDEMARKLELVARAKAKAFGKERLKLEAEELGLLQQESQLMEKRAKQAEEYAKQDYNNLMFGMEGIEIKGADDQIYAVTKGLADYGIELQLDEFGQIDMNSLMVQLDARYDAAVDRVNNYTEDDVAQKAIFELDVANIDHIKEMAQAYQDARDEERDYLREWQDIQEKILEINYENLSHHISQRQQIEQNRLSELENDANVLYQSVFKSTEAFSLLNQQMIVNTGSIERYTKDIADLQEKFDKHEISQDKYIEAMQSLHDEIEGTRESIAQLDEQLRTFYVNTIDEAVSEIDRLASHMDHFNSILEHYQSLLELTGQSKNYEKMNVVYEGLAKNAKNSYEIAKNTYEMFQKQMEQEAINLMNATGMTPTELMAYGGKDDTILAWKENWIKLRDTAAEYEDQMLSAAEDWADALNEILQNGLDEAAQTMEKALSKGMGFDALNNSLSRLSFVADEYLTKTNQLYETSKLISDIQNNIDKTNNASAKQRYSAFTKEIEQLQHKSKLSNLELEIAQARYKLLQAQIALEEAQQAKSTVRLSRDSEGNYGYVYTANQDNVNEAEQNVMDAENELYNIKLEAANNYAQQQIQARQDLANALMEIDQNYRAGAYASEQEYQEARALVIEEYTDLITAYSEMYGIATQDDSRVVRDAWTTAYQDIINDGGAWKDAINEYVKDVDETWKQWNKDMDYITNIVGKDLATLKDKVDKVNTASDTLKTTTYALTNQLETELTAVQRVTDAYLAQRDAVNELNEELRQYLSLIGSNIEKTIDEQKKVLDGVDISAVWAQYISKGGAFDDATSQMLLTQREAKVEALIEAGIDPSYYLRLDDPEKAEKYFREQMANNTEWFQQASTKYTDEEYRKYLTALMSTGQLGRDYEWDDLIKWDASVAYKRFNPTSDADLTNTILPMSTPKKSIDINEINSDFIESLAQNKSWIPTNYQKVLDGYTSMIDQSTNTVVDTVNVYNNFPNATQSPEVLSEIIGTLPLHVSQFIH